MLESQWSHVTHQSYKTSDCRDFLLKELYSLRARLFCRMSSDVSRFRETTPRDPSYQVDTSHLMHRNTCVITQSSRKRLSDVLLELARVKSNMQRIPGDFLAEVAYDRQFWFVTRLRRSEMNFNSMRKSHEFLEFLSCLHLSPQANQQAVEGWKYMIVALFFRFRDCPHSFCRDAVQVGFPSLPLADNTVNNSKTEQPVSQSVESTNILYPRLIICQSYFLTQSAMIIQTLSHSTSNIRCVVTCLRNEGAQIAPTVFVPNIGINNRGTLL